MNAYNLMANKADQTTNSSASDTLLISFIHHTMAAL